jgi:hypothetical protein
MAAPMSGGGMGVAAGVGVMGVMMAVVMSGLGRGRQERAREGEREGGNKRPGREADTKVTLEHTMIRWPFPGRETRRRDVILTKL